MSLNLITGYSGTSHITSASDGCTNAGLYGKGKYVLNIAEKFGAEIISNNLIRIKSGYAINQGRKIELAINDYEEVEIDNGLQGVKRCDLIVIHYEKNLTTGIETGSVKVIKGTSGDTYSDPAYTSGDIINGANEDDFLLYRVKINGLSIEAVEPLFTVTESLMTLLDNMQENSKKLMGEADISKIGNGTVKGAIVALADSDKKINQSLNLKASKYSTGILSGQHQISDGESYDSVIELDTLVSLNDYQEFSCIFNWNHYTAYVPKIWYSDSEDGVWLETTYPIYENGANTIRSHSVLLTWLRDSSVKKVKVRRCRESKIISGTGTSVTDIAFYGSMYIYGISGR